MRMKCTFGTSERRLARLSVTFAMALGISSGAYGQTAEDTSVIFDDWTVQCATQNEQKTCIIKQVIAQPDQPDPLLRFELGQNGSGGLNGLMIVPFGLDISKGVSLAVDGGARFNLPYRTCRAFGCVVPVAFAADAVELLKVGQVLDITLFSLGDQGNLRIPVSLAGFRSALEALQ